MFDPIKLMDPVYGRLSGSGGDFNYQKSLKREPIAMNWADPYRPNDTVPPHIKEAVIKSLNSTAAHYTFPSGDMELCREIAKRVEKKNGVKIDPETELTISNGSDSAFAFVLRPFMVPGELNEVLCPLPSYAHNLRVPELIGGRSVTVPTFKEDNYALRTEEFEKRLSSRTRAVLITNPNNPTGTVYTRENMEALADFCIRHELLCVVDQCFEDSVFDGHEYVSMLSLPGMRERTVTIGSISKGMGLCGFRVAYIIAPPAITAVLHQTAVYFIGATNTMAQAGIAAGLRDTGFMEELRQEWMLRARLIGKILDTVPLLTYTVPEAGFYFWIDVSAFGSGDEMVRYLVEEAGVLVGSGSIFKDNSHIRLIYGCLQDREQCLQAVESIKAALLRHPALNK